LQKKSAINVSGELIDEHTRCVHYHSPLDIIAIRMKCCNQYYSCIECHNETAGHTAEVWPADEMDTKAVLCGACYSEMTIREYLESGNQCPFCQSKFNPACSNHYHLYFSME
jgi:uncharacterized CHY-type Zn-finger protein